MINIQKVGVMRIAEFLDGAAENVVNKIANRRRISNDLPVQQSDIDWDSVLKKKNNDLNRVLKILLKLAWVDGDKKRKKRIVWKNLEESFVQK